MVRPKKYDDMVRARVSIPMKQAIEDICREVGVNEGELIRSLILRELGSRGWRDPSRPRRSTVKTA